MGWHDPSADIENVNAAYRQQFERANVLAAEVERLRDGFVDAVETVTSVVVILGGLTEVWADLDYAERCARAENELRALLERLPDTIKGDADASSRGER